MKIKATNRKTTNKKHENPNNVIIETAETLEDIEKLESSYRKTNSCEHWFGKIEGYLAEYLESKSLPSDSNAKYSCDDFESLNLSDFIKRKHLEVPGAFEAACALKFLGSARERQESIEGIIRNSAIEDSAAEAMIFEVRKMLLDSLKVSFLVKKVEEDRLNDYVKAGRYKITPAHKAKTETKNKMQEIAWSWIKELRSEGKTKDCCYAICATRFEKLNRENDEILPVLPDTVKQWFKSRKDFPIKAKK